MISIGDFVNIELAKKHLNIDSSFNVDDEYIKLLIEVSSAAACNHCNVKVLADLVVIEQGVNILPYPIKLAILLMVANLYSNREPVSFTANSEIPLSYQYLLDPYIDYGGKL